MKIAVFGLGKLGSVIAAIHANSGHEVVGIDISEPIVVSINNGFAPYMEPGLQDLIDGSGSRLSANLEPTDAVVNADASIIIVPTPSAADGKFSNEFVLNAVKTIGENLKQSNKKHTVIIASTVMPGSCDSEIIPALESSSGKKVGDDVGLVYNPQFIALGSIVKNMQNPDLILIGQSDQNSGDVAEKIALDCAVNSPSISRISLASAELAKIAINTFVTTKISFANMLGELCDGLPGANIDQVTSAVGSDSRVGKKYLQGALGYGGPCFPRDNIALAAFADQVGADASIAKATDQINDRQVGRIVSLVDSIANPSNFRNVAILGLAYKPDTPVCDESQSIDIANELSRLNYNVAAFDELSGPNETRGLAEAVSLTGASDRSLWDSEVLVVTHPIGTFKSLNLASFNAKLVIDIWGSVVADDFPGATIMRPGR